MGMLKNCPLDYLKPSGVLACPLEVTRVKCFYNPSVLPTITSAAIRVKTVNARIHR